MMKFVSGVMRYFVRPFSGVFSMRPKRIEKTASKFPNEELLTVKYNKLFHKFLCGYTMKAP